ncbi:zinc finger CCHC domain-containing protein 8-like isoform X2 [Symsagittifera roscoffensis]|uniref:zinc finger CCHC domain-containing protein 8-like isoform X2 n=1 Tax=Symsagittifera roscoffensis TaxID=84072 RepID=UPI00307CBC04
MQNMTSEETDSTATQLPISLEDGEPTKNSNINGEATSNFGDEKTSIVESTSSLDGDIPATNDDEMSDFLSAQRSMTGIVSPIKPKFSTKPATLESSYLSNTNDNGGVSHNDSEIENAKGFYGNLDMSFEDDCMGESNYNEYENCDLEREIEILREHNQHLESQNKLLQQFLSLDNHLPDEMNTPVALVVIPDNPRARYYKDVIEEFLLNLPPITESKLRREKKADEYRPMYQHASFNLYSLLNQKDLSGANNKVKMIYNSFLASGEYLVDSFGQPLVNFEPALTDGWIIPSFAQKWNMTIGDPDKPSETKKFQMSCFNCGGPHNLRECTEKRDLVRISQNRQALIERFGAAPGLAAKSTRYHLEVSEVDKRFTKFTPGRISQELREALGLQRKTLPLFVYKMRQLGYPPGWLIEAEVQSSGLDLIQGERDSQLVEDGEVVCMEDADSKAKQDAANAEKENKVTYNIDKLVTYPGFNSKIPEGVRDECNKMRPPMPPMQKHQQLVAWNRFLAKDAPVNTNEEEKSGGRGKRHGYNQGEDMGGDDSFGAKRMRLDMSNTDPADMDICEDEPVMPIIQPNEDPPFRGFIPPPPDSPLPEDTPLLNPMPPPVSISHWLTDSLRLFILDEDVSIVTKRRKDTAENGNFFEPDEDGEVVEINTEKAEVNSDIDDGMSCASTVEDTVRTLRQKTVPNTTSSSGTENETNPECAIEENDAGNEVNESPEKPKVFKLGPETTDAIRQYQQCVPPTEPHMFLFPDKNDPEVLEELYMNPPPESDEIQLGDEKARYKSAKGLPEYWKFSGGIEPYEAKEEVPILGLYNRILKTLKEHNTSCR